MKYDKLIEKLGNPCKHTIYEACEEDCDKPILIGNVLEEMKAHHFPKDGSGCSPLLVDMLVLWKPCGFTRSVQQISEDVEEIGAANLETPGKGIKQLKPSSEALLSFLEKLF